MEEHQLIEMIDHRIGLFFDNIIEKIKNHQIMEAWEQHAQLTGAIILLKDLYPIFHFRLGRVYPKISKEMITTLEHKRAFFISEIEATFKPRLISPMLKEIDELLEGIKKLLREEVKSAEE